MSETKNLIRREIKSRSETIVGTVLTQKKQRGFNSSPVSGPVWVVDVDVGSNRILVNVPVKGSGSGVRFYADPGQTVVLRRNTLGRFEVIGPGDRITGAKTITTYSATSGASTGSQNQGFTVVTEPFEFLKGPRAMKGAPAITFSSGAGTITRSDSGNGAGVGSFIDDGFVAGDTIVVAGNTVNDGTSYVIAGGGVAATVLTITAPGFSDEGPITGVAIGVSGTSRWQFRTPGPAGVPLKTTRIFDADGNVVSSGS